MTIYRERTFAERRTEAQEAKKALLEKFKARPGPDDPQVQAKKAEREAILDARSKRAEEKEKLRQARLALEEEERRRREAEEEAARIAAEEASKAEAAARESEENDRIARLLADEAERKAKRDARYAARKARRR